MSLPKLNVPKYTLELPSNKQKVQFRPFTVREEKMLLTAIDDNEEQQISTLRQVLDDCILPDITGKKISVDKLAMFDLDYVWLKIRSKSVEEIISLPFECRHIISGPDEEEKICGTVVKAPINLDKIEVKRNPENNPVVMLQDSIGIKLRYPTFEIVQRLSKIQETNDVTSIFDVIMECTEMIFDGDKTYENEHLDRKELNAFLESLSQPQFAKIMKFFETLPVLRHEVHFKCSKCKHEVDVVLEGTKSFLASVSTTNL
jgi:base plate protein